MKDIETIQLLAKVLDQELFALVWGKIHLV